MKESQKVHCNSRKESSITKGRFCNILYMPQKVPQGSNGISNQLYSNTAFHHQMESSTTFYQHKRIFYNILYAGIGTTMDTNFYCS